MACDAVLERVLLAENGAPLSLGRAVRTATPAQRRALAVRDGGCVAPGCRIPAKWCDVHHVTPWAHGGTTDIDALALLCPHDHTLAHQGILEIRMINGMPWVRPPAWQDPHRHWLQNTYWTHARNQADETGRQLRLALEPDTGPPDRPADDRVDDMTRDPPEDVPPETSDPPEAA